MNREELIEMAGRRLFGATVDSMGRARELAGLVLAVFEQAHTLYRTPGLRANGRRVRPHHGHPTDDGTVPLYGMLDVWMALHDTSHPEFDEFYAEHGYAETWSRILAAVRERRPVQGSGNSAQNSDDEREALIGMLRAMPELVEEDIAEVILAAGFRRPVQAEPPEVDADPDTAFELGRVAGYDEAMREVQAEPSDAQLADIESRVYDAHLGQVAGMAKEMVRAGWLAAFREGENRG